MATFKTSQQSDIRYLEKRVG